jgi:hypothetical protein
MCSQDIRWERRPEPLAVLFERLTLVELRARRAAPGPDKTALLQQATDLRKQIASGHFVAQVSTQS